MTEWEQICDEPLSKFGGHNVVEVSRKIQKAASRFNQLPIGPIGHLLTLEDHVYAPHLLFPTFIAASRIRISVNVTL